MKPSTPPVFDEFADTYDRALEQGLSVSGESKEFFARERLAWLSRCLAGLAVQPRHVLDFGCGTGSATPFLLQVPGVEALTGVDVSSRGLEVAKQTHASERVRFGLTSELEQFGVFDLAYCNGVFHHIPLAERDQAIISVWKALRPKGYFAFWENNPWNPGTRYVMSRIPFDRDAITLSVRESRRRLRQAGFRIIRTDFLFLFPHALRWFRWVEPAVARLPLGAQYQVLAQRES